jgi:hypothetical protein
MCKFHPTRKLIALVAGLVSSGHAQTGQIFFQTTTFGIVGLARDQVARLNVLNPGNAYNDHSPVCSAEMTFLDEEGRELKLGNAPVGWGKAASLEFDRAEQKNGPLRLQIRGVVKSAINRPNPTATSSVMPGAVCSLFPTLEIFDKNTGKTVLILTEGRSIIFNTPSRGTPATPPAGPPAK